MSCQLATLFTCQCPKCLGDVITTVTEEITNTKQQQQQQQQDEDEDLLLLFSAEETTISSTSSTSTSFKFDEDCQTLSSFINMSIEAEEESTSISLLITPHTSVVSSSSSSCSQQQKQKQQQQPLQRSFLQIARSLKRKQECSLKPIIPKKPTHLIFDTQLPFTPENHSLNKKLHRQYKFNQKRIYNRINKMNSTYMPSWCYEENCNSLRSLREMIVFQTSEFDFVTQEPIFNIYDRRLSVDHIRLPISSAIANRRRNNWILRNRIFNGRKPDSHMMFFSCDEEENTTTNATTTPVSRAEEHLQLSPASLRTDTRGDRNFDIRCKFYRKDDSLKYNRNGGFCRNKHRNNGWEGCRKWNLGNSLKRIHGKPWLRLHTEKLLRGKRHSN